jgi:ATP-dependent exoDNAse (exonuclease V) beta subunit
VKAFIDGLSGDLSVEEPARLPLEVEGDRVTISGVVDLVHLTEDRVEIVDYKTDTTSRAHGEYRKQLSVYYHVLSAVYNDREVISSIYYTAGDGLVTMEPLTMKRLSKLVKKA